MHQCYRGRSASNQYRGMDGEISTFHKCDQLFKMSAYPFIESFLCEMIGIQYGQ